MLKIDLRVGESITIGNVAVVTLEEKSGKIARLSISAEKSVPVVRTPKASAATIAATMGLSGDKG